MYNGKVNTSSNSAHDNSFFLSWLIFWWPWKRISKFHTQDTISIDETWPLPTQRETEDSFFTTYTSCKNGTCKKWIPFKNELLNAIFLTFKTPFFWTWIPFLLADICSLLQLYVFQNVISSMEQGLQYQAVVYVALLTIINISFNISDAHLQTRLSTITASVENALISTIYRKVLSVDNASRRETLTGEIINLVSSDADKVSSQTWFLILVVMAPLRIVANVVGLYYVFGSIPTFFGVLAMVVTLVFHLISNQKEIFYFAQKSSEADKRVSIENELIQGIRVVKLFGWENRYVQAVGKIRAREHATLIYRSIWSAGGQFFWSTNPIAITLAIFAAFTWMGNILLPSQAFLTITLTWNLSWPLFAFPWAINRLLEAKVSFERINKFLEKPDIVKYQLDNQAQETKSAISIRNGEFTWANSKAKLSNINLEISHGKFIAIIGAVGSGKSSLLSAILNDMQRENGHVYVDGKISFSSQQAWIQNSTLRDNISFGKPLDMSRYQEVIDCCALSPDLEMLPNSDLSLIGEKGINLSGGQKQRVNLARAVYADVDIYLFDDPLSAVDANTSKHIMEKCLSQFLRNKTRVLVTHHLHVLPHVDHIIFMKEGMILGQGTYKELMSTSPTFTQLIQEHARLDSLKSSGNIEKPGKITENSPEKSIISTEETEEQEEEEFTKVNRRTYREYFEMLKSPPIVALNFLLVALGACSTGLADLFLSKWSNANINSDKASDTRAYMNTWMFYQGFRLLIQLVKCFVVNFSHVQISSNFHTELLTRVIKAPMRFFDTTPVGRIVNRFSKDMSVIDNDISFDIREACDSFAIVILTLVLMGSTIPPTIIGLAIIGYIYNIIFSYYNSANEKLETLSSTVRSPIFSHFSETLSGTSTIRAFGDEHRFIETSDSLCETYQRARFAIAYVASWRKAFTGITGSTLIATSSLMLISSSSVTPGVAGLILVYLVNIVAEMSWLLERLSAAATDMNAVQRIIDYSHLPSENYQPRDFVEVSPDWPSQGSIEFKEVRLKYSEESQMILDGVSFKISPKEKIGICGRTGAGKSSLITSLFRIVELHSGTIFVDDVDISKVPLQVLRTRMSIIPQDPILFSGTIRSNLDPFSEFSDFQLWKTLQTINMKQAIEDLPEKLDSSVSENGENFSVGQRQLICLGRALLRKNKNSSFILVMDEATASVDLETDALIQKTIRSEFSDCTVLTIAHRLDTILDYDRVLVMNSGRVEEFGNPVEIGKRGGLFASMLAKSKLKVQDK